MFQTIRPVGWTWALLMGLAAALSSGCESLPSDVEQNRDEFRRSRREAELLAQIATRDAKLEQARLRLDRALSRGDQLQRDLAAERNARRQEKLQYDLAVQLNADMKRQLEEYRGQQLTDDAAIKTLRNDVAKWRDLLARRDEELAQLREKIKRLEEEVADLRRQARR